MLRALAVSLALVSANVAADWATELELGAVLTSGNTEEENLKFRIHAVRDGERFKHGLHADETGCSACRALLSALLPQPWDHRTSSADGQRLMLQGAPLPSTVRASWNHPQVHQTLHTAYQRQGRAVHRDCVA